MKFRDDNHYIERVINGDIPAYASLVEKHKNLVFSIAMKILNNREDAEEIAQDTFLKAFNSLRSFEKKSKFTTWLYRIAYNGAVSKKRKKKMDVVEIDDHIMFNYSTDEISHNVNQLNETVQTQLIEKALSKIPKEDNLLITLFYKSEHSIEDISYITGLSQSNVKVKLHRIRKKLYEEIQEMIKKNSLYLQ
jgi:RNA polymerase sigma-70 factor (ECF subfamily)